MYAEALSLLDSKEMYERAYTLYRLQRENEARDILEKMKEGEDDRGTVHLEAQLV
jgi:signal recognition particle subunit SRP72